MPDLPGLPGRAWIQLQGPFGSGSGAWDRVDQRENGVRALHPESPNSRVFGVSGLSASQILLYPKSC